MHRFVVCSLLALSVSASLGCSDEGAGGGADASKDGIYFPPPPDGSGADRGDDGSSTITTNARFAQLSPDLGDSDFCYRVANGGSWIGPVIASASSPVDAGSADAAQDASTDAELDADTNADTDADAGGGSGSDAAADAGSLGLPYGSVSGYFGIAGSGTFDIGVVAAGSPSCTTLHALGSVTLDASKHSTIVAMGLELADAGVWNAARVVAFTDDVMPVAATAQVRFVHAAIGSDKAPAGLGPVAASAVTANGIVPLAAEVDPAHAASASAAPPTIDALGYHGAAPFATPAILKLDAVADAGMGTWSTPLTDLDMTSSSLHTGFICSDPSGGVAVLWCDDVSLAGTVTHCRYLPAQ